MEWPAPKTIKELRGFLGLTGYYRKFIQRYGILAHPLTQLFKTRSYQWTKAAQQAFKALKKAMVTALVLALPNFDLTFEVESDAYNTGIGVVLS